MGIALGSGVGVSYGVSVPVVYLFRDSFYTAEAAPLTSPRSAEPGPGTLTITDTENKLSIAGGKIVVAGGKAAPGWGDPRFVGGGLARATGRTLLFELTIGTIGSFHAAWANKAIPSAGNDFPASIRGYGAWLRARAATDAVDLALAQAQATYQAALVQRSDGFFTVLKGDVLDDWTLLWVSEDDTTATLYPAFSNYNVAGSLDDVRVTDLGGPWATDYGLATERLSGARAGGDTFSHEADCIVEFVVGALPTAGQIEMWLRKQDASNYWAVTVDNLGNLDLDEVVAGVPTQRGTSAAAVAPGDRVVVIADDETLRVYVDPSLEITYASAANFKTETDGELETEGTGGAVTDIVAWPRSLSGAARAALERV